MAPLNYSKWDNLDLSDDDKAPPAASSSSSSRPAPSSASASSLASTERRAPVGIYSSGGGLEADPIRSEDAANEFDFDDDLPVISPADAKPLSMSNPSQRPGEVAVVEMDGTGGKRRMFEPAVVDENDEVFWKGKISPISTLIGFEIRVLRLMTGSQDNQPATFLMIEADDGFAKPEWQGRVGPVRVARTDKKPLAAVHVEALWMLMDHILDRFGDGDFTKAQQKKMYTPEAWKDFYVHYLKGQLVNRFGVPQVYWDTVLPWDI